jgi:hypothetical protein
MHVACNVLSVSDNRELFTSTLQVCLDYWNSLVCDLFQSECNMETPVTPNPVGLQVIVFAAFYLFSIRIDYCLMHF